MGKGRQNPVYSVKRERTAHVHGTSTTGSVFYNVIMSCVKRTFVSSLYFLPTLSVRFAGPTSIVFPSIILYAIIFLFFFYAL